MDDLEDAVAFAIFTAHTGDVSRAGLGPRIGTSICGWRALPFVQLPPICEQELTLRGHRSHSAHRG